MHSGGNGQRTGLLRADDQKSKVDRWSWVVFGVPFLVLQGLNPWGRGDRSFGKAALALWMS